VNIDRALKGLSELKAKLEGPRCRYSTLQGVSQAAETILEEADAQSWIRYKIDEREEKKYRQEKRGRPGTKTRWRRSVKIRFRLRWETITENLEAAARIDGIFPLLTDCVDFSMRQVLEAYKSKQPLVEARHDLLKNTLEVTPAFLKSVPRLEAYLFAHYIAVTVHALIERELRKRMRAKRIKKLPLYPEGRDCKAPTMARISDFFEPLQRHILRRGRKEAQRFPPELTPLHEQVLQLTGMSARKYHASWQQHD
jgi:transposase